MGEPDRCQGPVRQIVVFYHCVTGRKDLVHNDGSVRGHGRKGALVTPRVNPFYGHRLKSTSLAIEDEHFLSGLDLAGENRRHPLLRLGGAVMADEKEVRGGEGYFLARVGFDDVEDPPHRRIVVYKHDEVRVN